MKSNSMDHPIVVALDIGTNKIAVIIGKQLDDGTVDILSVGTTPSEGLKKGVVVNIEDATNSIRAAIEEAESTVDFVIREVCVGIAGGHIRSINCEGMAPIRDSEVTQTDIERAIETAKAVQLPADQQVLHVLPHDFAIDDQQGIKDPLGMSGYRLSANVHMVTGGRHPVQNIVKCVKHCGLSVSHIVLDQIASSQAVLTEDEKELGVCLLDIGGGTTDMSVFVKGTPIYTSVIAIGGDHVTNDIAVTFRTPTRNAEDVKIRYGCALTQFIGEDETIEILGVADRPVTRHQRRSLGMIIEPRYEELFELVNRELQREKKNTYAVTGYVLTGGASKMEGAQELAQKIFNAPVRIGRPQQAGLTGIVDLINNPIYATGVGLLLYAIDMATDMSEQHNTRHGIKRKWNHFRQWFQDNF